ncbi:MAG: hypothetical protein ABMA02_19140 [Saprospiraceae bacterium]
MLCPNCGHSAQPNQARCGHCNYKLPESDLPGAASGSPKVPCWNCLHGNDPLAPRCVACNAKTEKQPAPKRPAPQPSALVFTPNASIHDE